MRLPRAVGVPPALLEGVNMTDDANGKPVKMPKLVPQPHGGALMSGGTLGHRGGGGRPPSELRARMRDSLEENFHVATEIAQNPDSSDSDRLRALDFLARFGLGLRHEITGDEQAPVQLDVGALRREILGRLPRNAIIASDQPQLPSGD